MYVKVHESTKVDNFSNLTYNNTGSCSKLVTYLSKEGPAFFDKNNDTWYKSQVIEEIDKHNKGQLKKDESKFYMLTVNPSAEESAFLIGRNVNSIDELSPEDLNVFEQKLQSYTQIVMDNYAQNFKFVNKNEKKIQSHQDLHYFAKIEHSRYYNEEDIEVKNGLKIAGDKREGLNTHIHVVVSRKAADGKTKLCPEAGSKAGFYQEQFSFNCVEDFETMFAFKSMENLTDNAKDWMEKGRQRNSKNIENKIIEESIDKDFNKKEWLKNIIENKNKKAFDDFRTEQLKEFNNLPINEKKLNINDFEQLIIAEWNNHAKAEYEKKERLAYIQRKREERLSSAKASYIQTRRETEYDILPESEKSTDKLMSFEAKVTQDWDDHAKAEYEKKEKDNFKKKKKKEAFDHYREERLIEFNSIPENLRIQSLSEFERQIEEEWKEYAEEANSYEERKRIAKAITEEKIAEGYNKYMLSAQKEYYSLPEEEKLKISLEQHLQTAEENWIIFGKDEFLKEDRTKNFNKANEEKIIKAKASYIQTRRETEYDILPESEKSADKLMSFEAKVTQDWDDHAKAEYEENQKSEYKEQRLEKAKASYIQTRRETEYDILPESEKSADKLMSFEAKVTQDWDDHAKAEYEENQKSEYKEQQLEEAKASYIQTRRKNEYDILPESEKSADKLMSFKAKVSQDWEDYGKAEYEMQQAALNKEKQMDNAKKSYILSRQKSEYNILPDNERTSERLSQFKAKVSRDWELFDKHKYTEKQKKLNRDNKLSEAKKKYIYERRIAEYETLPESQRSEVKFKSFLQKVEEDWILFGEDNFIERDKEAYSNLIQENQIKIGHKLFMENKLSIYESFSNVEKLNTSKDEWIQIAEKEWQNHGKQEYLDNEAQKYTDERKDQQLSDAKDLFLYNMENEYNKLNDSDKNSITKEEWMQKAEEKWDDYGKDRYLGQEKEKNIKKIKKEKLEKAKSNFMKQQMLEYKTLDPEVQNSITKEEWMQKAEEKWEAYGISDFEEKEHDLWINNIYENRYKDYVSEWKSDTAMEWMRIQDDYIDDYLQKKGLDPSLKNNKNLICDIKNEWMAEKQKTLINKEQWIFTEKANDMMRYQRRSFDIRHNSSFSNIQDSIFFKGKHQLKNSFYQAVNSSSSYRDIHNFKTEIKLYRTIRMAKNIMNPKKLILQIAVNQIKKHISNTL